MNGQPVWLASVSRFDGKGRNLPASTWRPAIQLAMERVALAVLDGVGDRNRERVFRMCVTLCVHRALTADEVAQLPPWFHDGEAIDIAGGPVEILRETESGRPSTRPSEHLTFEAVKVHGSTMHLPVDCGECGPCHARLNVSGRPARVLTPREQIGRMLPEMTRR